MHAYCQNLDVELRLQLAGGILMQLDVLGSVPLSNLTVAPRL